MSLLAVLAAGALLLLPGASVAANPTSVTIAGSLEFELGCPDDWQPGCALTHLTYDAGTDLWTGTFTPPAGKYEYKAALNDSWDVSYGLHGGSDNIPLDLSSGGSVKFYYDDKTHWITDNRNAPTRVIAVAVGSFQSELGCTGVPDGDWQPGCLRSWLEDPDGDGTYTFETTAIPPGDYETKVAINESWDENYGAGGAPGGANIPFHVLAKGSKVDFSYDGGTHILTVTVTAPPVDHGKLSHFDLARKDCLGTARNTTSKVWYTLAGGVLSDVYYPTVDNTNVETLQYVVTDGSTFTDLQARDMTYTVEPIDDTGGMGCRVTATARSGKYTIETDYVTDPGGNALLMNVHLKVTPPKPPKPPKGPGPPPPPPPKPSYQLYVRFDPSVNGNGGGGAGNGGADDATVDTSTGHPVLVASDTNTATQAANRDYAQPVFAALDGRFDQGESGLVGSPSDGLVQLDADHALTSPTTPDATDGNVVQTARVALAPDGKAVLALGFGGSQADAVGAAEGSLAQKFDRVRDEFKKGWKEYDKSLNKPHTERLHGLKGQERKQLEDEYYLSANVIKASEDKTFPGAIVASLASPWGQAVSAGDPNNTYFGSYREVFARDLYEAWTGLMADGDLATARDATLFLLTKQQQPDGSMPRNSLVNGKTAPDSFGTQLDETSYPILMADQLGLTDHDLYVNHIRPAANFVASHGPAFGVERWEEQSGYSPSTIAAEIAGLVAAADLADANGDAASAAVWRGVADDYQRSIKGWTVTTTGGLAPRYFIRLSKTGDPNAAISYNVGNGGPTLDQRAVIDAGFLELVRLGALSATDPDVLASLPVVDATIGSDTASGFGWHRYNGDGYGDGKDDGHPWAPSGQGTGHLWPALSAERGEQDLATGDTHAAASLLLGMSRFASGVGLIPEQDWELPDLAPSPYGTDPTTASIGFANGGAAGSASPLTWSAASFVRLTGDLAASRNVLLPAGTYDRYVAHSQGATMLTVSSPADNSAVSGPTVTVAGKTAPGNAVYVSATNTEPDNNSATTVATATAAPDGSFSVPVAVTGGTTVLNTVAVAADGSTAHDRRAVVFDSVPGTLILTVSDPDGDDNGPGNYAYPTSNNFHPGAFDLEQFQVYVNGPDVIFRVRTRDLTPTFGPVNGAQLVDVYVRQPGASPTSTLAANGATVSRNFTIDPSFAWTRLLQVQGFGQRYEDTQKNTVGTIAISANQISRYITFKVSAASLGGTPGPGWSFVVVLTGQGISDDQARTFKATPQEFDFGVCATNDGSARCTAAPVSVPKVMDVITPPAVSQADELDYTQHDPVKLKGVTVP